MVEKPAPAILMNYDNVTVVLKAKSSKKRIKSTKQTRRRLKAIIYARDSRVIVLDTIQSAKNLTDSFTKGV